MAASSCCLCVALQVLLGGSRPWSNGNCCSNAAFHLLFKCRSPCTSEGSWAREVGSWRGLLLALCPRYDYRLRDELATRRQEVLATAATGEQ